MSQDTTSLRIQEIEGDVMEELRCIVHGLPSDLIPLFMKEEHWGTVGEFILKIGIDSYKVANFKHDGYSDYFTVGYVMGMWKKLTTSDGDGHMFSMMHTVWRPDWKFGEGFHDNMVTVEELENSLKSANFVYCTKDRDPVEYSMEFSAIKK